jgi:hypothetical protein
LQAIQSLSAPDGAVMVAASSVDATLKAKKRVNGSLYARINEVRDSHLMIPDMADWAHDVRFDANNYRHADLNLPHHTLQSAERAVEFAAALAEALFVLPAHVQRGRNAAKGRRICGTQHQESCDTSGPFAASAVPMQRLLVQDKLSSHALPSPGVEV